MTENVWIVVTFALLIAGAMFLPLLPARKAHQVSSPLALCIWLVAMAAGISALSGPSTPAYVGGLDRVGSLFWMVNATIGAISALVSAIYLKNSTHSLLRDGVRWYHLGFYLFWATLLAIPAVTNLGTSWLLIEASTGTSALLVAYSGTRRSLEAGWKYLILTTMGLTVAFAGIVLLDAGEASHVAGIASLDWATIHQLARHIPHGALEVADILIFSGMAAKVGWAPVHHWLPDAHSESPAPVSAMLSASLLPSVLLVIWRLQVVLGSNLSTLQHWLFLGFGLASLAVSVPFLWRPLPVKRLLAYSSLEHMGIIALGIGFATPLALMGVLLHFVGHAFAKALGFYATLPATALQPRATTHPLSGMARLSPSVATGIGVSLASLAGIPPSPLFISELLIIAGGIEAHQIVIVIIFILLLALGFIGLMYQMLDALLAPTRGDPRGGKRGRKIWTLDTLLTGALIATFGIAAFTGVYHFFLPVLRSMV